MKRTKRNSLIFLVTLTTIVAIGSMAFGQEFSGEDKGIKATLLFNEKTNAPNNLIRLENHGNAPIELNESADKCFYITKDGKQFSLPFTPGGNPADAYYQHDITTLNPEEKTIIALDWSYQGKYRAFLQKYAEGEIAGMLLMLDYDKIEIRLTPIKKK